MAPKKGKKKKKNAKSKLKTTPISMKSRSPGSSENKSEKIEIRLDEEEGKEMHSVEEQDWEKGAEEEGRVELEEDKGVEEEGGVDLDEERVLDLEEERKIGGPTDEESQHPHTPLPQKKWGQGRSYLDMVSHGIEEATARTEDLKKASMSVRSDLLRPVTKPRSPSGELVRPVTKPSTGPSSSVQGSWLPKERSLEDRLAESTERRKRLEEYSAKRKAEQEMKARMVKEASLSVLQAKHFLTSFRKPGEENLNCSMCVGRVASMLKKGGKVIKIDFRHLLSKQYKELALQIGRKTDGNYSWLKPTLVNFLVEQGMAESEAENVELSFKNCPARIQTVQEFMQNRELIARDVSLLQGARIVYVAAALGRGGFKANVNAIFSKHDEGITFNGGFTLEDLIMLDEEKAVVLADPFVPEKTEQNPFGVPLPEHMCSDVKQVWKLFSPFYIRKDANDTEELPLHFEELKKEMLGVKEEEVCTEKFRELIRCCFALASCAARVLFTKEVYTITRQYGIGADPALRAVFETIPPELVDFKVESAFSSIDAVRLVALFGPGTSRFDDNRYGCLELDRQVQQHGGEHCGLKDMDELELLTSSEFKGLLHAILKAMIYAGDPHGKYGSLLSAYKTLAKHDKQDLPTGS